MTKLDSSKRIHEVRTRGGNTKYRALRLDSGNFAWGSEAITRKTRLLQVVSVFFLSSWVGEFGGDKKFGGEFHGIWTRVSLEEA